MTLRVGCVTTSGTSSDGVLGGAAAEDVVGLGRFGLGCVGVPVGVLGPDAAADEAQDEQRRSCRRTRSRPPAIDGASSTSRRAPSPVRGSWSSVPGWPSRPPWSGSTGDAAAGSRTTARASLPTGRERRVAGSAMTPVRSVVATDRICRRGYAIDPDASSISGEAGIGDGVRMQQVAQLGGRALCETWSQSGEVGVAVGTTTTRALEARSVPGRGGPTGAPPPGRRTRTARVDDQLGIAGGNGRAQVVGWRRTAVLAEERLPAGGLDHARQPVAGTNGGSIHPRRRLSGAGRRPRAAWSVARAASTARRISSATSLPRSCTLEAGGEGSIELRPPRGCPGRARPRRRLRAGGPSSPEETAQTVHRSWVTMTSGRSASMSAASTA